MANESKKLQVDVVARIDKLEKAMSKAAGVVNSQSGAMEKRLKRFSDVGNGYLSNLGKGLLAGVAAGGITGIIKGFGDVAKSVSDIGRAAKQAGLDTRSFQELKYVAEANRIGVDSLTDGLKELSLRADEFATTGKGSAAESFQRLGIGADELKKKLADPSALFTEIIGKLGQLDKAAQIRISDELFGGNGGEKFVQLISQGEAGIRATISEAHTLGAVMTDDVIKSAEELDKQFNIVSQTVGNTLKSAIVGAYQQLSNFIDLFNKFEDRKTETLQGQLDTNNATIAKAGRSSMAKFIIDGSDGKGIERLKDANDKILQELRGRALDQLKRDLTVSNAAIDNPIKPIVAPTEPPKATKAKADPAEKEREKAAKAAETEADKIRQLISDLEFERSLIGKSAIEKAKMTEVRNAGAAATDAERKKIEAIVEATYKENAAHKETQRQLELVNDTARDVAGGIVDGLLNGAKGADILAESLKKVSDVLLNEVLDSIFKVNKAGGSGGSILGSIFGALGGGGGFAVTPGAGLFSDGGYTGPGGKYQPAGLVHKGEVVWSQKDVARSGGVGAVEAMRRGYADGGIVGMPSIRTISAPSMPRLQTGGTKSTQNLNLKIDVTGANGDQQIMDMVHEGVSRGINAWKGSADFRGHAWAVADKRVKQPRVGPS